MPDPAITEQDFEVSTNVEICFDFLRRTVSAALHGLALLLVIGTAWPLVLKAEPFGLSHSIGTILFCSTAGLVFLVSSLYHYAHDGLGMPDHLVPLAESMDHVAIYLFIAGTYTPLLLKNGDPVWTPWMLTFIWGIAICGVIYTIWRERFPVWMQSRFAYTGLFVLMAWTFLLRAPTLVGNMGDISFWGLIVGGTFYTIGALIYALEKPNPWPKVFGFHEIWHTCVLFGWASHYVMVYASYSV